MRILKYELPWFGDCTIDAVAGSVLSAKEYCHQLVVYIMCEDERPQKRRFYVADTGEEIRTTNRKFIDTVITEEGACVMHVFEDHCLK